MRLYKYMRALDSIICPMRYKCNRIESNSYTISERLKKMIDNSAIYLANPKVFNDPFDGCFAVNYKDDAQKEKIIEIAEAVYDKEVSEGNSPSIEKEDFLSQVANQISLDNFRVSCLCKEKSDLMWSHYADEHKGICLVYELEPKDLNDEYAKNIFYDQNNGDCNPKVISASLISGYINYSENKVQLELSDDYRVAKKFSTIEAIYTKSKAWSYEKEFRISAVLDFGYGFADYPVYMKIRKECLKEVIFGIRLDNEYIEKIKELYISSGYSNIKFMKATLNKDTFSLDYKQI